ncbi:hypothetical protein TSOC_004360 [Tetrabaena socialis]|uniref:Pherophorin domain-containing protein n=1 Tax=Tetrabaena socialis TaxID=47790 RepID=A0A2J8A936_9CHLO|nr:hypothetical protein TSOC_004360 [Tetrabaena socialis]|eukprot:PNH09020.1 hypothetical protein TSOC_004360 [Tetrabaena socialis]
MPIPRPLLFKRFGHLGGGHRYEMCGRAQFGEFPYAGNCDRDPLRSNYTLTLDRDSDPSLDGAGASLGSGLASLGLRRYCFTVVRGTPPANPSLCSSFDLARLDLEIKATCAVAVAYAEVGGQPHPITVKATPPLLRIGGLLDAPGAVMGDGGAGLRVCLVLRQPCTDLRQLCGNGDFCRYSLADRPESGEAACCPTSTLRV